MPARIPTLLLLALLAGCSNNSTPSAPTAASSTDSGGDNSPAAAAEQDKSPRPVEFIPPPLTESEISAGWISLFDGVSLFGWQVPPNTNWQVSNGEITADSGEKSLLLTPFNLDDFEFRCSFNLAAGGNSGVFLRTADNAADPSVDTYELNICDSHATHRTGSLVGRLAVPDVPAVEGAWHDFLVRCEGPRIQVWLDSTPIVDFTDQTPGLRTFGRLGLQKNEGRIAFKNVCIRPLRLQTLFNGNDTSGWRTVPGSKASFTVKEGLLNTSGGPGFLETEQTFQNFALKASVRINGEKINGGIFFRAEKGTEETPSNGYELQLNNTAKNNDPNQPADFGTGAIFRRAPARRIIAKDQEFFTVVLIADGDIFSSWVNGWQVVNWQDQRPSDPNPRKGRRLEAGHLSLQGHDPGTSVDFKSIEVHNLPSK
jgi:hypothetical protein